MSPQFVPFGPSHLVAVALTLLMPLAMALAARHEHLGRRCDRATRHGLAALLLGGWIFWYGLNAVRGDLALERSLPMHLCDWAQITLMTALVTRNQFAYELGYFWGLCGTLQALFTPAISRDLAWWKQAAFFLDHAGIVAGVLFLLLVPKMRPLGLGRIVLWSEIYIASALAVNALTGGNYGFLSHRPEQASLLDLFPDARWLYVATINAVALVFFTAIYLPWLCVQRRRSVGG